MYNQLSTALLILTNSSLMGAGESRIASPDLLFDARQIATCPADTYNMKNYASSILLSADSDISSWREGVGLANVNPQDLSVVTHNPTCGKLERSLENGIEPGYSVAYLTIGNRFIIVEYPSPHGSGGVLAIGYTFVSVRDSKFKAVGSSLVTR